MTGQENREEDKTNRETYKNVLLDAEEKQDARKRVATQCVSTYTVA